MKSSPAIALAALLPVAAWCNDPLPDPLTLEAALATAHNPQHFQVMAIDERLQEVRAELGLEASGQGFRLDFNGRLREVGLNEEAPDDDDGGDSAASLVLSKPLYDFGRQDAVQRHLELQLQALEQQKALVIAQRRLQILEKYFAVLNADNRFLAENEALATHFGRFERAQEDMELGLRSEIEVLRLQTEFEMARQSRLLAQQRQRLTRSMLAEAMGYPGQLASNLEAPRVDTARAIPADVSELVERALQFSLEARVAMSGAQAAQAAIQIADATDGPTLDLELEVSTYERVTRTRDDWRAGLYIEIPIYRSSSPARRNVAMAQHRQALATQQETQSRLRLEVLELWQQLQHLQLEIAGHEIERDYRERYLDRSRAEYELEYKTDLGDSSVLYSSSHAERLRSHYQFELTYRRLAALVGMETLQALAAPQ